MSDIESGQYIVVTISLLCHLLFTVLLLFP